MSAADWFRNSARYRGGWHVVPGTALLLRHVLPPLAAGASDQDVLRMFPALPPRHLPALRRLATADRPYRDRLAGRLSDFLERRPGAPDEPPAEDSASVLGDFFEENPVDWAFDRSAVRELTARMILFLRTDKPFCGAGGDPRNFPFASRQEFLDAWSACEFSRDQDGQGVQPDGLVRRRQGADLLDDYLAGRLSRRDLEDRWPRPGLELSLHRIAEEVFDELPPGRAGRLDEDVRALLLRCRDFLRLDIPYDWPRLRTPNALAVRLTSGGCFMCGLFLLLAVLMAVIFLENRPVGILLMLATVVLGTIIWLHSIVYREESPRRRILLETPWPFPPGS